MGFTEDFLLFLKSIIGGNDREHSKFLLQADQLLNEVIQLRKVLSSDKSFADKLRTLCKKTFSAEKVIGSLLMKDLIDLHDSFEGKSNNHSKLLLLYTSNGLSAKKMNFQNLEALNLPFENLKQAISKEVSEFSSNKYPLYKQLHNDENSKIGALSELYISFLKLAFTIEFKRDVPIHEALGINLENKQAIGLIDKSDSLEKVKKELNELIGLDNIKTEIEELSNLLKIQKSRTKKGLKNVDITLHSVFTGSPGTGKTTVARLLARLFFHLGYISKGHLVETDREGLVAGYVGQTATKTNEIIEKSRGGVLFIDEAYSLTEAGTNQDYGAEAISTLLKRMEDYRSDLIVVIAGYPEPINLFIQSNPGLRSRFTRYFEFKNFTSDELLQIFKNFCKQHDFKLHKDAEEKLNDILVLLLDKKFLSFSNARDMRNLFEKCVQLQANRIVSIKNKKDSDFLTLKMEDIPDLNEIIRFLSLEV